MHQNLERERVRQRWGKLSEDDLDIIGQDRAKLVEAIEMRYGCGRDAAEAQVKNLEAGGAAGASSPTDEPGSPDRAGTQPPFGQDKEDTAAAGTLPRDTAKAR